MKKTIPNEFAGFIREVGVRAFDSLAERLKEKEKAAARLTVLKAWKKLSRADKESLMDELIATAQDESAAPAEEKPAKKKAAARKKPATE